MEDLSSLLVTKLDDDEQFMKDLDYLTNNLQLDENTSLIKFRIALEEREVKLNSDYLTRVNEAVERIQNFDKKIQEIYQLSCELTEKIHSNKEKSQELLRKTSILQNEKKQLAAKQIYLDAFFKKYCLTNEEGRALEAGPMSDAFRKAILRLGELQKVAAGQAISGTDKIALIELSEMLGHKLNAAYQTLYNFVQQQCRLLNMDIINLKPDFISAFELLHSREDLFRNILEEYATVRRTFIVRNFIDSLTKTASKPTAHSQRSIEYLSNEPLRYVNEMLAWVHEAVSRESETLLALTGAFRLADENFAKQKNNLICNITETLCQPLRLRLEQCILKESNCVVLYRLSTLVLYYARNIEIIIPPQSLLLTTYMDLHELSSNMFFSSINSTIQRILSNMSAPDYDLIPVNAVNQALLLLRDILESQNDTAFSAVIDKRAMHSKIFNCILDPLSQAVQIACSSLEDQLDVAVYMINYLNAVRSVIILYQYTDAKLEMIKAQIEANEDVLVSEQASKILEETAMLPLYMNFQNHQQSQGPLSKIIPGMEPEQVMSAITRFNAFICSNDRCRCHQIAKIGSAIGRENVQKRTLSQLISAYKVIWTKLKDPANQYPVFQQLMGIEDIEKALFETF